MELSYDECKSALRLRINAVDEQAIHWLNPCSQRQCSALVILMNQCLYDNSKEVRLAVLKEMINIPLQSTKDLLKWEATCLIDFIKEEGDEWRVSEYGRKFIEEAERRISHESEECIASPEAS